MKTLVLLRHGQSTWNKENLFTGWTDVPLTERGMQEAGEGASILEERGFGFDIAFTSLLSRAIKTLWIVMERMDLMWIPVYRHWRLNERHYGALQGLNKAQMIEKHGEEQVHQWRRSYAVAPPPLSLDDPRHPSRDPRYADMPPGELPLTESLKDTVGRFLPFWHERVAPMVKSGQRVLIVAHGNSLRALVKNLDRISDEDISSLEIPTGVPLVYELEDDLTPIRSYYPSHEG